MMICWNKLLRLDFGQESGRVTEAGDDVEEGDDGDDDGDRG